MPVLQVRSTHGAWEVQSWLERELYETQRYLTSCACCLLGFMTDANVKGRCREIDNYDVVVASRVTSDMYRSRVPIALDTCPMTHEFDLGI